MLQRFGLGEGPLQLHEPLHPGQRAYRRDVDEGHRRFGRRTHPALKSACRRPAAAALASIAWWCC